MGERLRPVKEGDEKNAAQTRGELDHVDRKSIGLAKLCNIKIPKLRINLKNIGSFKTAQI